MDNFLCQNVLIIPLWILLTRRSNTFWSMGIKKFWSGSTSTVWTQKVIQKTSVIFTKILNYTKSSSIIFYTKMSRYSSYTYCYLKHCGLSVTTYWGLRVSEQFDIENHKEKIINVCKIVLNYNFS